MKACQICIHSRVGVFPEHSDSLVPHIHEHTHAHTCTHAHTHTYTHTRARRASGEGGGSPATQLGWVRGRPERRAKGEREGTAIECRGSI